MSRLTRPVGPDDHVFGPSDARITVVAYVDYECRHCARAHAVVSDVMDQVDGEVRLVIRHFPLCQIHPHALFAAEAAEAAASQGLFWPMHAMLFENQDALDPASLGIYADVIGLDVPRFTHELHANTHLPKVQADFSSGVQAGVNGTPTFFVDGARLDHGWDAPTLLAAMRHPTPPVGKAAESKFKTVC
jgi:protein-disulfide isomerase